MKHTNGQLTVTLRHETGKGASRRLRQSGRVPGVIYGQGKECTTIAFSRLEFQHAIDPERRLNTLFFLDIEGGDKQTCVIADYDVVATRGDVQHVDFLRIDPAQEVVRTVPVSYTGRAAGVMAGGKLKTLRREVQVRCKANAVPVHVEVDVTPLEAGQSLKMSDVVMEGVVLVERPTEVLALVEGAKAKTEDAESEAAPAAPAAAPS